MDRYFKAGVLAVAGLISGLTVAAAIPFIRKSLQHRTNKPKHRPITLAATDGVSHSNTDKRSIPSNTAHEPTNLDSDTNSSSDFDTNSSDDESFSISQSEIQQGVSSTRISDEDLPQVVITLTQTLKTYDIKTETVRYHQKQDRDETDSTVYCKNLFLKDRKGTFYYFICREDNNVNLRQLKYKLHAHRNFSFASAQDVEERLHLLPGCITPFTFLSESVSKEIVVAISRDLMFEKKLNFHPLHEDFATRISFGHLLKLFGHLKRKLNIIDL